MRMLSSRSRRGSALLITLIALAVLMLLVVAAIQFTGTNRTGAGAKLRGDELAACGEAARRYLVSQLQIFGNTGNSNLPINSPVDARIIDQATESDRTRVYMAHYDETDAGIEDIAGVSSAFMGAAAKSARDLSNAAPTNATLGGNYYRVVMKCRDLGGRENEVEFLFRFGI